MNNIKMVDLKSQYFDIKNEVDLAIQDVIDNTAFIKGPQVKLFESNFSEYLGVKHVIGCANGTDALQVAFMALELNPGDEVIVPSFTYAATAEIIALLNLKPIMVDVTLDTFEIQLNGLENLITEKTKAIIPVHLFGQCSNMDSIMAFAKKHNLFVVEDNAQAIGADYKGRDLQSKAGTVGHIGCTSFFPAKNLGCYGDGGAVFTNDDKLAEKIRMICNHGEKRKYYHDVIGCNSRLDSIQAAVLNVKLKNLDFYNKKRSEAARTYNKLLQTVEQLIVPYECDYSSHIFHQYTLRIINGQRDALADFLKKKNIPYGIYYPIPLYKQKAYAHYYPSDYQMKNTEILCKEVISLPMHSHLDIETQVYITNAICSFFKNNN